MILLTAALAAVFQAGRPQTGRLTVVPQAARLIGWHQTTVHRGAMERVPTDGEGRRCLAAGWESGVKCLSLSTGIFLHLRETTENWKILKITGNYGKRYGELREILRILARDFRR